MDRGRAGGYVGNNFVQIQLNKKKRQQHLDRIKKIKTRKPGSSATLDNNPPVIIEAMLNDPRKSALRHHFNFVTERENKVLLKRISAILTAPPKITDKQYQEMKKLVVPSTKGFRNVYEQNVTTQKNKEFFDHLKKLQPYYKAEDWEKDYQKQLFNQKFMRQVKYKRPPGFVDPLAPPVSDDASTKKLGSGNSQISEGDKDAGLRSSSSSHVSKIRAVKLVAAANKGSKSVNSLRQGRKVSSSRGPTSGPHSEVAADEEDCYGFDFDTDDDRGNSSSIKVNVYVGREGGDEYEHDSFFRDDEYEFEDGAGGTDENRVQLATIHRTIRIAEDNPAPDSLLSVSLNQDQTVGVMFAEADIQCWLINNEYVVISAVTLDKGRILDAEAEISIADLSIIRGLPPEQSLLGDTASLESIAREMVENVELKVDCGVGRLVLNLVSEDGDEDYEDGMDPNALLEEDGPLSHTTQSAAQTKGSTSVAGQPISALLHSGSLVSEEEIESMLLGDQSQTVLLKGVRLPVSFNVNANAQSVGSITALIELAKRAKRIEHVYALLKFVSTSDDQMAVTAQFITDTTFMFKRGSRHRPAVQTGSVVRVTTSLPSVIQADPDMLLTFAENLVQSLKVEHDCKTGENELIIIA